MQLPVLPQVPHLDALRTCRALRDGDLVSADRDSLYVFLFACREPDVDAALQRLFSAPLEHFFSSQTTDSTQPGIRAVLERLRSAVALGLPDYSLYLEAAPAAAPGHAAQALAPPATDAFSAVPALPSLVPTCEVVAMPIHVHARPIARRSPAPTTTGSAP